MFIKHEGAWEKVTPSVKVSGQWTPVQKAFIKMGGTWFEVYSAGDGPTEVYPMTLALADNRPDFKRFEKSNPASKIFYAGVNVDYQNTAKSHLRAKLGFVDDDFQWFIRPYRGNAIALKVKIDSVAGSFTINNINSEQGHIGSIFEFTNIDTFKNYVSEEQCNNIPDDAAAVLSVLRLVPTEFVPFSVKRVAKYAKYTQFAVTAPASDVDGLKEVTCTITQSTEKRAQSKLRLVFSSKAVFDAYASKAAQKKLSISIEVDGIDWFGVMIPTYDKIQVLNRPKVIAFTSISVTEGWMNFETQKTIEKFQAGKVNIFVVD